MIFNQVLREANGSNGLVHYNKYFRNHISAGSYYGHRAKKAMNGTDYLNNQFYTYKYNIHFFYTHINRIRRFIVVM